MWGFGMLEASADWIGVARLYGEDGLARLKAAHVLVAGVGGVGSWCVEALARTGVGALTLVDGDRADPSNVNRQLHALVGNYGRQKVELMAERIACISNSIVVRQENRFITKRNVEEIVLDGVDWVVDCIDDLGGKAALVAAARRRGIPVVSSGGAGARRRPECVKVEDLAFFRGDRLAAGLRARLRRDYGFPSASPSRPKAFGILCVGSDEQPRYAEGPDGSKVFGAGMVVTATVGLRLASIVIEAIAQGARRA